MGRFDQADAVMNPRYHEAVILAAFLAGTLLLGWLAWNVAGLVNEIHETHSAIMRLERKK